MGWTQLACLFLFIVVVALLAAFGVTLKQVLITVVVLAILSAAIK